MDSPEPIPAETSQQSEAPEELDASEAEAAAMDRESSDRRWVRVLTGFLFPTAIQWTAGEFSRPGVAPPDDEPEPNVQIAAADARRAAYERLERIFNSDLPCKPRRA